MSWKLAIPSMLLLLLIGACSGRSDTSEQIQSAQPTAVESVAEATKASSVAQKSASVAPGERIAGGTLVRLWTDPPTLDPHLTTDATSAGIIVEVFGGLMTIDLNLDIVPDLAEKVEPDASGTVYTFHLRKGRQIP